MKEERYKAIMDAYLESMPGNEPSQWIELIAKNLAGLAQGPFSKPAVLLRPGDLSHVDRIMRGGQQLTSGELVDQLSATTHPGICQRTYLTLLVLPPRYESETLGQSSSFLCAQYHHIDKKIPGSAQKGIQSLLGEGAAGAGEVRYSRLPEYPNITFFYSDRQTAALNPWADNGISGNLVIAHRENDDLILGIDPYSDWAMWGEKKVIEPDL